MRSETKIQLQRPLIAKVAAALAALAVAISCVPLSIAQNIGQQTFNSAEQASQALYAASQQQDDGALLGILGPDAKDVISSGDPTEDMNDRVNFVLKYQQMHRLAKEPDGTKTLYVGAENWPFPIPVAEKNGAWFFDTDAGKEEILSRRIGKNELAALDASEQLVDAEKQYYAKSIHGEHEYAQRFVSEKGKHNGLFWTETVDELESPLNPLIAYAGEENTPPEDKTGQPQDPVPYNGYYFRILPGQGSNAEGGAKSYVANSKMVAGFAFVAYPVEYRSSGVMTFIVNQDGVIYEKDLGPDTTKLGNTMTEYNPDSTWHEVN